MEIYPAASAHGRFQPFHNGHLEYILTSKLRCAYLWIGIAAPDPVEARRLRETKRERPENNPLSYFERVDMITASLVDHGVSRAEFGFVPFPIEQPALLPNYIPVTVPCLTTVYDDWNREKVELLRRAGYTVIVLYERSVKEISGSAIRAAILRGTEDWQSLVPPATVRAVVKTRLAERLRKLTEQE
jgi:nicotinamide mononucleotide adenylyltransferase